MKYIDADLLRKEIGKKRKYIEGLFTEGDNSFYDGQDDAYNNTLAIIDSLQQEQPDNEDIDKVAQELYEHLYELKRRNNVPTNLYDKQEIIDLWKAGIVYGRSHPKQEQPEVDLEEAAGQYLDNHKPLTRYNWGDLMDAFKAGAEWGEKNAYKAIMKKADEVRDKRFDTDYEVKIDPAAGFDFGCVNVYREGKLVGQYVEPKEEKKLPEGVEEAADNHIRKVTDAAGHPGWDWETQDIADAFKAGAEWQSKKEQDTIKTAEDHAFLAGADWQKEQFEKNRLAACDNQTREEYDREMDFSTSIIEKEHRHPTFSDAINYGIKLQKEQMVKNAVEGEVVKDISNKLAVTAKNINLDGFKFGDKVRVIIVKEEEE